MKKIKFKSAAEKRQYEENQRNWEALNAKYESISKAKGRSTDLALRYSLSNPVGRERVVVPSLSTSGGNTAARESMMYSGDKMIGVGMLHKSNLVPVFKADEAKDLASMRR
jgi:hypothetical protein